MASASNRPRRLTRYEREAYNEYLRELRAIAADRPRRLTRYEREAYNEYLRELRAIAADTRRRSEAAKLGHKRRAKAARKRKESAARGAETRKRNRKLERDLTRGIEREANTLFDDRVRRERRRLMDLMRAELGKERLSAEDMKIFNPYFERFVNDGFEWLDRRRDGTLAAYLIYTGYMTREQIDRYFE